MTDIDSQPNTAITLRQRFQERSVSQHPLQRRADLATFQTAIASGGSGGRWKPTPGAGSKPQADSRIVR